MALNLNILDWESRRVQVAGNLLPELRQPLRLSPSRRLGSQALSMSTVRVIRKQLQAPARHTSGRRPPDGNWKLRTPLPGSGPGPLAPGFIFSGPTQ